MNNKKLDGTLLWKQFEDVLVPTLRLNHIDRAVYSHLLRHTLLEGKPRIRLSVYSLARGSGVTAGTARQALRRLADKGAVRLIERTQLGHLIEVRRPDQIRAAYRARRTFAHPSASALARSLPYSQTPDLEALDFFSSRALREAIHARDRGLCFYCLCRLKPRATYVDHVVARAHSGRNSYRNLVSCCLDCNSQKREKPASDFLRWLYRQGRITALELTARLRALRSLAAGKLRPVLPTIGGRQTPPRAVALNCRSGSIRPRHTLKEIRHEP